MYKKAIDILMADETDLKTMKAIAVEIAKSNPSVFVKAANIVLSPELQDAGTYFNRKHGDDFFRTLNIPAHIYENFINKYGKENWLKDVLTHMFSWDNDNPQKIKAIKALRAGRIETNGSCGLKQAKEFVEDLQAYNLPETDRLW